MTQEELKTYKMVDEKYCADCVCVIPSEVYLKSEADKVIAHHKYKRCRAMAMWCETRFAYYIASRDRYDSKYVNKKAAHFYKWKYKWLALAKKFKEAK